jgi:hypothetical protein
MRNVLERSMLVAPKPALEAVYQPPVATASCSLTAAAAATMTPSAHAAMSPGLASAPCVRRGSAVRRKPSAKAGRKPSNCASPSPRQEDVRLPEGVEKQVADREPPLQHTERESRNGSRCHRDP